MDPVTEAVLAVWPRYFDRTGAVDADDRRLALVRGVVEWFSDPSLPYFTRVNWARQVVVPLHYDDFLRHCPFPDFALALRCVLGWGGC